MMKLSPAEQLRRMDNAWLHELKGRTLNAKTSDLALRYVAEQDRVAVSRGLTPRSSRAMSFVAVTRRRERHGGEILGIGGSHPGDLTLNNFGIWFAATMRSPSTSALTASITNTAGVAKTIGVLAAASNATIFNIGTVNQGTQMQVGSSTVAPARGDYAVGTAFVTSPESGVFGTGVGSYSAGKITVSGSITAGGSGTVNEDGFFWQTNDSATSALIFMILHDAISPGVAFVATNPITQQTVINM